MSTSRNRLVFLLLSAVAIAVPCLGVSFPPVTDLPQHLGQVRLLLETLRNAGDPYVVQPLTPYWGAHALLLPVWLAVPAQAVASAAVLALGLAWAVAVHALAWKHGRAPEAALLASLFFFSQSLYWGFAPFIAGWPVYLLWVYLLGRTEGPPLRRGGLLLVGAALLYWCHALWFAMGMLTLAVSWATRRPGWRAVLLQGLAVAPVGLLALWWFPQLEQRGFSSPAYYFRGLAERLSPGGLTMAAFGGLRDSVEGPVLLLVFLWLGLGLWQHRGALRQHVDPTLLPPALLLLACALALPDKYSNTIVLAERWMPGALALLLLALPGPRLPTWALRTWAVAAVALLSGFTAMTWRAFERLELSGLEASLTAVPERSRVVGLTYLKQSPLVLGRPYLQAFSYAYVLRGAELNFSFAWFAPSPVVLQELRAPPWAQGLEWYPERLRARDLRHFDYAVVALPPEQHPVFQARMPALRPVTGDGIWRLYRVEQGAVPAGPASGRREAPAVSGTGSEATPAPEDPSAAPKPGVASPPLPP